MTPIHHRSVRNIIFDLGGVILNIDYYKTEKTFIDLGIRNFNQLFNQFHANSLFKDLERGAIDPEVFVAQLKAYAPGLSEKDIITAWNAMLLDFPPGRIAFLLKLKTRYRTFLLSNTNAIHHEAFQKIELDTEETLDGCFEKVYYSHEIGLRKPDRDIFEFVMKDNGLLAQETLFLDDTLPNIDAAASLRLQTIFIKPQDRIEEILGGFLD